METFENLFNLCQIYLINFQLTYFMAMVKEGVKLCKLVPKKINNCIYKGEKNQKKYTGRWFRGQSTFRVQGLGKLNQTKSFWTLTPKEPLMLSLYRITNYFLKIFIGDLISTLKHKKANQHPPMVKDQKGLTGLDKLDKSSGRNKSPQRLLLCILH